MKVKVHVLAFQEEDNSSSIENILLPITYTSWLLGVGIAHPRKYPKAITIIIRIFYMTVCSICMVYDAAIYFPSFFDGDVYDYVYCLNKVACYVSAYYYILHGIRMYKWPELMDRLKELDQKIRKEISINDRSVKIVEALAIFATIFYSSIPVAHYYIIMPDYSVWRRFLFYLMCYGLILSQSLINSFVFDVIVYVVYCRFQTINKLIGQLDTLSDVLAFKIRRIRELHTDICDLVNIVKDTHGLSLLFCSMYCFIMAMTTLFQFYYKLHLTMTMQNYMTLILKIFLCIVYVSQFYLICWICTLACQESKRTGKIIYEIILKRKPVNLDKHKASNLSSLEVRHPLEDLDGEQSYNRSSSHNLSYVDLENLLRRYLDRESVIKEINDFSIQLQQNRVAFTACNFFEIHNSLFRGFIEIIITYLIIISQFNEQYHETFRGRVIKDLGKLQTNILELKKEILGMVLKGNQTDS